MSRSRKRLPRRFASIGTLSTPCAERSRRRGLPGFWEARHHDSQVPHARSHRGADVADDSDVRGLRQGPTPCVDRVAPAAERLMTRRRTAERPNRRKPTLHVRRRRVANLITVNRWRQRQRDRVLRRIASRTVDLAWSQPLLRLLIEELYVDETFQELVGPLQSIPVRRFPHVIAVALVLRHSWRPDDLRQFAKHLGIHVRV